MDNQKDRLTMNEKQLDKKKIADMYMGDFTV
jgi:hypothetical protein